MTRIVGLVVSLAVLAFVALFVIGPLQEPACAATAQVDFERTPLRLLLVTVDEESQSYLAWADLLADEGAPFDTVALAEGDTLTTDLLEGYQGVVLADSHLAPNGRPDLPSLLDADARAALVEHQRSTGMRVVAATITPDPSLPFTLPPTPSSLDGLVGELTDEGEDVFPYLQREVPVEAVFGFVPLDTGDPVADVTTLVEVDGDRPLVATLDDDGAETMYIAPQVDPSVLHWRLLRHGVLDWLTRGVHLGLRELFFAMQVDDIFLPNFRWDEELNQTRAEAGSSRMIAADVAFAADWVREHDLRLDMAFNASGRTSGVCEALLDEREEFGWVNHTYAHRDLDELSEDELVDEITLNRRWAEAFDLPGYEGDELVTGAHTGLQNPAMPGALERAGILWIAADASREPEQRRLGPALTVPRYPTNIFYDTSLRREQLDEYDHVYFEECNADVTRCRDEPITWEEFVEAEADLMLRKIVDGDPRIHYTHQSNLTDDRVLYEPLERLVERYRQLLDAPLLQPTLSESGEAMRRMQAWTAALAAGEVDAWLEADGSLHVLSRVDVEVPITGSGDQYGSERHGWFPVEAGVELAVDL